MEEHLGDPVGVCVHVCACSTHTFPFSQRQICWQHQYKATPRRWQCFCQLIESMAGKKRGNLGGRPQSKTLINKYGIYEYVCLFVCAGGRSNPRPPQKSHPPLKTDWCRALQLTPRAPSINQLPELSMQEMMFWKLAPSAARGGRGWFDMWYSENKEKQVSGNHVYSLRHRGEEKSSFSWRFEVFILTDLLSGCNGSIARTRHFHGIMSRCQCTRGAFRSIIIPFTITLDYLD